MEFKMKLKRILPYLPVAAVYLLTFSRDMWGGDSPELISAAYFLSSAHPPGYPLFTLLFRVFMFIPLNPAIAANLFNVIISFLSLVLIENIVKEETKNGTAAVISVYLLAFSRMFWYQSMYAETYTLNLFMTLLSYYIIVLARRNKERLKLFFFLAGVALGGHNLYALVLPAFLFTVIFCLKPPVRNYPLYTSLFLFGGLSVYTLLLVRGHHDFPINWGHPSAFGSFWTHITRGQYEKLVTGGIYGIKDKLLFIGDFFKGLFFQFFFLTVFGTYGAIVAIKNRDIRNIDKIIIILLNVLGPALLIPVRFTAEKAEIFSVYYLQAYAFFVLMLAPLVKSSKVLRYIAGVHIAAFLVLNFRFADLSGKHIFRAYNTALLKSLPQNARLVTDGDDITFGVLYLRYVEGLRPDITCYDGAGNLFEDVFQFWRFRKSQSQERYAKVISEFGDKYGTIFASRVLMGDYYDKIDPQYHFLTAVIGKNKNKNIPIPADVSEEKAIIEDCRTKRAEYLPLFARYLTLRLFAENDESVLGDVEKTGRHYPEIYNDISYYYFRKGESAKAADILKKAYEMKISASNIAMNYANVLIETHKFVYAVQVLDRDIKVNGESYEALYSKGVAFFSQARAENEKGGRIKEPLLLAADNFKKALKYNPEDHRSYTNLGLCFLLLGDLRAAKEALKKAVDLEPSNEIALNALLYIEKNMKIH